MRQIRFPDSRGQVHVATVYYDFDLDGGVGDDDSRIVLPGVLPAGALVFNAIAHILIDVESSDDVGLEMVWEDENGDTQVQDLIAAESVAGWTAGLKVTDILKVVAGEGDYDPFITPFDVRLAVHPSEDLTAGRMAIHLTYIMSPTEIPELASDEFPEIEA